MDCLACENSAIYTPDFSDNKICFQKRMIPEFMDWG